MPARFRRARRGDASSADQLRERRLEQIKALAERFVYDLGLLIAGHPAALEEYVAGPAATRLRTSLEPFLAGGDAMRPNFGEYGELRVEGDLLNDHGPLIAEVEFDDHSVLETAQGDLLPAHRRRTKLSLTIAPGGGAIAAIALHRTV